MLTETQLAIRDMVRNFAQEQVKPRTFEFELENGFPQELFEQMAGLGLWGMTAPEEFGGAGVDTVSYALSLMEIAAADGTFYDSFDPEFHHCEWSSKRWDGRAQGKFFDLIGGQMIGAFALTEADAGSDASAIRTRATKVDGGWRLSGSKQFITSGRIAGLAIVIAGRTRTPVRKVCQPFSCQPIAMATMSTRSNISLVRLLLTPALCASRICSWKMIS